MKHRINKHNRGEYELDGRNLRGGRTTISKIANVKAKVLKNKIIKGERKDTKQTNN